MTLKRVLLSWPLFEKSWWRFLQISCFCRSFYLSLEIKKALRNQESTNQRINLICPNGVSYVIGQWAIWMSGNCCVPLSGQHSTNALEYYIKDSDSVLVITAPSTVDKVLSRKSYLRLLLDGSFHLKMRDWLQTDFLIIFLFSLKRSEKFARRLESPSFVKIQISLHTQILTLKMRALFHHWFLTRSSIPRTNQLWCSTCLVNKKRK